MQSSTPVHNPNSRINDKTLYNYFINDWEQNLAQHSNGKLCTYATFKTCYLPLMCYCCVYKAPCKNVDLVYLSDLV